jgi:aspartyl-tRNA(Asn)/glutamyl-tRNA(Gln) amidotransferase subunit A
VNLRDLSITDLAKAYREKIVRPSEVTEAYLESLQVGNIYLRVLAERALTQAKNADALFEKGIDLSPLQGVPIAIKDLLDTKGDVTSAGSKVLAENPPVTEDATLVKRLDKAGAIFLGKTNMTELAFSGLGLNPHFGTPGCALDETRIPGGSSSGSGVAVAKHLACAALGSDTGGSVRIPASFNGIVGLKTTNGDIPTEGCVALSTTLDTLGPMTRTVEDAWLFYLAMAEKPYTPLQAVSSHLRFLVPTTVVLDELDDTVATAFEETCNWLEQQGHTLKRQAVPELEQIVNLYATHGSFAGHESLALYEEMLEQRGDEMDARVSKRILQLRGRSSTDYLTLVYSQQKLVKQFWHDYRSFDAILSPTVAILPPTILSLANDEAYFKANNLVLRNTLLFNFLAGPAVSVPCAKTSDGLSVGLMVATAPHREKRALEIARIVEARQ